MRRELTLQDALSGETRITLAADGSVRLKAHLSDNLNILVPFAKLLDDLYKDRTRTLRGAIRVREDGDLALLLRDSRSNAHSRHKYVVSTGEHKHKPES